MEIKPSNPKIVHHVVVYAIEPDAPEGTPETGVQLHEYAVGKYGDIFGENTGRLLKKGTRLRYDMHYFAIGSEQHNKTTIAFKFYPKGVTPKYQVALGADPQHPERRARGAAQHRRAHRRLLPPAEERAHRRVPAAHAHARARHDARSDQPGRATGPRSSARSITSTSTGTSTTSTRTTRRRCCRRGRCCT